MALFEYISLFVAILFIIFYSTWQRNKNVRVPNWLVIGMLPSVFQNLSNAHDFVTLVLKHHGGTFHFKGPWLTNMANIIFTCDHKNVLHITSKNFSNYGKGPDFLEIFEAFGVGILNLDSNEWKKERELLHSLLKRKSFEIFHQRNIQKKLENSLLPLLDLSCEGVQVIDLQDIFDRFTFDITCTFLFGLDSNSLPCNFNNFSDVAYVKAIHVLEETVLFRHCVPKCLWKLQKWLQIGQEKKNKVALENLHQFLYRCITYCKGGEDKHEYHSCFLKELTKLALEKDESVENYYLRNVGNINIKCLCCYCNN